MDKAPTEVAPDFNLPDSTGATVRLSQLAAASGRLVVLLYRGYW
jgi:peroxiredoxin